MPVVRELTTRLGFDVREEGANRFEKRIGGLKTQLTSVNKVAAAAAAAITVPAAAVEKNVAQALTLTGQTGDAFTAMSQQMIGDAFTLARELKTSAQTVSSGYYNVLSAGVDPVSAGFNELLATAIKLERTTGLALPQSVEQVTTTVAQFNLEMEQAGLVADQLFAATKPVQVTLPQLAAAMREAGAAAQSVNADFPTTLSLLDALAQKGIRGSQAGTSLRIVFTRLSAATGEAADKLAGLGITPQTVAAEGLFKTLERLRNGMNRLSPAQRNITLKTIAGEEAFGKLQFLLDTSNEQLVEWRDSIEAATGALDEADKAIQSTTFFALKRLGSSLQNTAGIFGGVFNSEVGETVNGLADIVDGVGEFLELNPKLQEAASDFLKVALAVGALAIAVKFLGTAFKFTKIGLILVGISELVGLIQGRETALERLANLSRPETRPTTSVRAATRRREQSGEPAQEFAPLSEVLSGAFTGGGEGGFGRTGGRSTRARVSQDNSVTIVNNGPVTQETIDRMVDDIAAQQARVPEPDSM